MKIFAFLLPFVCLAIIACERHEFEGPDGTKRLHEKHGAHDEHATHDDHEKKAESHDEHEGHGH